MPEGTPITAPLAGVVTGINAPDGSLPAWGAVVTYKLTTPYNSVATHIAFLHLSSIAAGIKVGSTVSVGTVLGTGGSGPNAAGSQKAALGFAFYNGDYYGYGPTWAQYDGSAALNPTAFLDSLKNSPPVTTPPPTNPPPPVTQTLTVHLAPNADVTALLIKFDSVMTLLNPFNTTGTSDPFSWIAEVGANMWEDLSAFGLRLGFIVVGTYMLLKTCNEFIDYGALVERLSSVVAGI
jgi:hypothetical protein